MIRKSYEADVPSAFEIMAEARALQSVHMSRVFGAVARRLRAGFGGRATRHAHSGAVKSFRTETGPHRSFGSDPNCRATGRLTQIPSSTGLQL